MINESRGFSAAYTQIHVVVSKFFKGCVALKKRSNFVPTFMSLKEITTVIII